MEEGRQALVSYFQAKGYFDIKVETQTTSKQGDRDVIVYQINKEKKHKVAASR